MNYLGVVAIFFDDFFAVVDAIVVKYDEFKILIGLTEYGVKTLPKLRCVIVIGNYDRN